LFSPERKEKYSASSRVVKIAELLCRIKLYEILLKLSNIRKPFECTIKNTEMRFEGLGQSKVSFRIACYEKLWLQELRFHSKK